MSNYTFSSIFKDDLNLYLSKREKEVVPSSMKSDLLALSEFDRYISLLSVDEVTSDVISGWINSLSRLRDKTIDRNIASVRCFLKYENAIRNKHHFIPEYRNCGEQYVPYFFTEKDKDNIYTVIDSYKSNGNNILPWITAELPMITRIMEGCGTRIAEILCLRMQDVDLFNGIIIIKNAKLEKQRRVPMSEDLSIILEKYCYAMGIVANPTAYLFPRCSKNECLKVKDVTYHRFVPTLKKLGIRNENEYSKYQRRPCLYNLRHTFAVNSFRQLCEQGISIDDIVCYLSVYMGHKKLSNTMPYLQSCVEIYPESLNDFYDEADQIAPGEEKWDRWGL